MALRGLARGSGRAPCIALLALLVTASVAGCRVFSALLAELTTPTPDPITGCVKGQPPASLTVILIDTTDPLDAVQKQDIEDKIKPLLQDRTPTNRQGTPTHGEVMLFTIQPVGDSLLRPQALACNPGSGAGQSQWTGNPRLMQRRWRRIFADKLKKMLAALLTAPDSPTSPIMESVQSVAVGVFEEPRFEKVPKNLVIVSDMVQNTGGYSQYREHYSFARFQKNSYYLTVRPELDGVNVSILYLRRPATLAIQTAEHIQFWRNFFEDAGVKSFRVKSVEG